MRSTFLTLATAILCAGCGSVEREQAAGPTTREHQVVQRDQSALTRMRFTMGAGELHVKGGATALLEADFSYSTPTAKPSISDRTAGTERDVDVAQGNGAGGTSKADNRWDLALTDATPLDVIAHLGAGQAHLTLGSLRLHHVELQVGAGEAEVDLRGNPTRSYRVEIRGGAGSVTVRLPNSVAIAATASGGLGEIHVSGLDKRDGRWINPRVQSSAVTIELDVKGGVGEITINAE